MTHHHEENDNYQSTENKLSWQRPFYYWGDQLFIPKIYDEDSNDVPERFNAVKVLIDGKIDSLLNWRDAQQKAQKHIENGLKIFWEIDLGLFKKLSKPLSNETQYKALCLSLEHFRNSLWKEFHEQTIGLCLYRGPCDFTHEFKWDQEQIENLQGWLQDQYVDCSEFVKEIGISIENFQEATPVLLKHHVEGRKLLQLFCRNAATSYLELLLGSLPDALQPFLLLETDKISDLEYLHLLNKESYERFQVCVNNPKIHHEQLGWDHDQSTSGFISKKSRMINEVPPIAVGVCWPNVEEIKSSVFEPFLDAVNFLQSNKILFRMIPISNLTADWDGLDYVFVSSSSLDHYGKRKLQGFCAAGGTVVFLKDQPLGVNLEISFDEFSKTL